MGTRSRNVYQDFLLLFALLQYGFIPGCTPTLPPVMPPESYKGPIAEQPILQKRDYWVYQRGNLTKAKTTALPANMGFPLWIGKVWSYDGEALLRGQPATSKAFRTPTRIDCRVIAFSQVTVTTGTFGAF